MFHANESVKDKEIDEIKQMMRAKAPKDPAVPEKGKLTIKLGPSDMPRRVRHSRHFSAAMGSEAGANIAAGVKKEGRPRHNTGLLRASQQTV